MSSRRMDRSGPVKVSLVKPKSIDNQPAKNRIEFSNGDLEPPAQPGQSGTGPTSADMQHIDMALAGAVQKSLEALLARSKAIQQGQRHRRAFIGKAALLERHLV